MSTPSNDGELSKMLATFPVIALMVLANTLIAFVIAGVAFIQFIAVLGWSKGASLIVAILIAIAVHVYIIVQPKIRAYISARS